MTRVVTFGTFDLFHLGHLNILQRAKGLGDYLAVGISSDELNYHKKHAYPTYPLEHRMKIVEAIRYVDSVFVEHSLEKKREYLVQNRADILVMGEDWQGKFDYLSDICRVVYLPRTEGISSTGVKQQIQTQGDTAVTRQQMQSA